jgi:hypothetical protein
MISTLISLDRSARRVSSLALVGAAAVAACDTDQTVAPKPTTIPTEASAMFVAKPGVLVITIVDQDGNAPKTVGAQFTYTAAGGGAAYFLVDNGSGDSDPTPNVIRRSNLLGSYNVCQTVAPTDYVLPSPACQTVSVSSGTTATLKFVDKTVALIQWTAVDMFDQPVAGATFTVDVGNGPVKVADNSPLDLDKTDGRFMAKAPNGTSTVCPFLPPTGWYFNAGQGCGGGPAPAGQTTFVESWHLFPWYSVLVLAADPITWGAGPSSYIVTNASGFSATLVDQGTNDRWSKLGHMWMLLPSAGDYTICQTTPPPGTKLANPSCVQFTVKGADDPMVSVGFVSDWQ